MQIMKLGTDLTPDQQREVLSKYPYRHTQARHGIQKSPVQFVDDADWLAHTEFAVTKSGKLCRRSHYCHSTPTWPNNPELR